MAKRNTIPSSRLKVDPKTAIARRRADLDFTKPGEIAESQGTYAESGYTNQGLIESPFESNYFNSKILGIDLGPVDQSAFNPLGFNSPLNTNIDFEKIRADKQSAVLKLGNTGIQFLGKTAVGLVGNIVGGFYGMGSALANWDGSKLFDNSVYRSLDEANESIEANNTVFLNRKKGPGLNMELLKDVSDAFSFIASAVASEVIMQTVGNLAGGAGVTTAAGRLGRYVSGANKLLKRMDDAEDLQKLALELNTTVDKLAKYKRSADMIKAPLEMGRKMLTTTGYEAGLEARGVKDQIIQNAEQTIDSALANLNLSDEEKAARKAEFMKKAEQAGDQAGIVSFFLNSAVVNASNIMQFPSVFGSSYFKAKNIHRLERRALGEVGKKATNKYLKAAGKVGTILKSPATEFMEETMQGLIGSTYEHYYDNILSVDTNTGLLKPIATTASDSLWHGLKETYGTSEGLYEGIIGAIVGGIGLPSFKRKAGKVRLGWQGGIYESVRDMNKKKLETETLVDSINSIKMSEALKYNRDNAIIATADVNKEEEALENDDKNEFDKVQDNKVFRYTTDRVRNGLEDSIDEDIQELRQMNLEKYKEAFGKDESFTAEDKQKEVEEFKKKTDIYREAFKAAHKVINLGNTQYATLAQSKLGNILTHALATEKIIKERRQEAMQKLYDLQLEDITKEELDAFAETSGTLVDLQEMIDDYIAQRNQEKNTDKDGQLNMFTPQQRKQQIREQMDPDFVHLLDNTLTDLQTAKEQITAALKDEGIDPETSVMYETLGKEIDKALKYKAEYDIIKPFEANKSSKVRKMRKEKAESHEAIVEKLNKELEKANSEAMKTLGKKVGKITTQEFEKYLDYRKRIQDALNAAADTKGTLERIQSDDSAELLMEVSKLTRDLTTAVEVAASLYGLRNSPDQMLNKLGVAELQANLANGWRKSLEMHFMAMNNEKPELIAELAEELKDILKIIEDQFAKYEANLNQKGKELVKKQIAGIKETLKIWEKVTKDLEAQKEQREKAKEAEEATEEDILRGLDEGGVIDHDADTETDDPTNEEGADAEAKVIDNSINRLVIRERTKKGEPYQSMDGFDTMDKLIAEGKVKNKAATTIQAVGDDINDSHFDPEQNPYLKKILEEAEALSAYKEGLELLREDPAAINSSSVPINTVIRFFPATLSIYDKQAEQVDEHYEFDIEDSDTIIYKSWLWVPTFEDNDNEQDYQNALKKAYAEIDAKGLPKSHAIHEKATAKLQLEQQYKSGPRSTRTLLEYRKLLLQNFLKGENQVKLKVHNVDNGNMEKPDQGTMDGREYPVSELGFDANTMAFEDITYTDQYGNLTLLSGIKTANLAEHWVKELNNYDDSTIEKQASGHLYFGYKTKNGKKVPIKMNLAKLSPNDVNTIMRVFKEYILSSNRERFVVDLKPSDNPILHMQADAKRMTMDRFMSFFLKSRRDSSNSPLFLKNTFNLTHAAKKNGNTFFQLEHGKSELMLLEFPQVGENNKDEILAVFEEQEDRLRELLLEQRHNFNKEFFTVGNAEDTELNKKALAHAFESGLINHAFKVNENFDRIFKPEDRNGDPYNKTVVISRADVNDEVSDKKRPRTYANELKKLRWRLGNNTDEEISIIGLFYAIEGSIERSIKAQLRHLDIEKASKADLEAILQKAIDNIIGKKIADIKEVGDMFPGKISNIDHEANTKLDKSDTTLDELLKLLYRFKNESFENEKYKKATVKAMRTMSAVGDILKAFRKPPAGKVFKMMNFAPDSDNKGVVNNIQSAEQLESYMRIINILNELTQSLPFVHVAYTETYAAAKGRTFPYKYKDPGNLSYNELKNSHHKTRLKSVQIEEEPIWKDGELVAGRVYFNFGTKGKDGKVGNQKVLVLSKDMALEKATNIMTNISLPFINTATMEINEEVLEKLLDDVAAYKALKTETAAVAMKPFSTEKKDKKVTFNFDDNTETEDDNAEDIINEQLENSGLLEDDSTPKPPKPPSQLLTDEVILGSSTLIDLFDDIVEEFDDMDEDEGWDIIEQLKEFGITDALSFKKVLDTLARNSILDVSTTRREEITKVFFKEDKDDCDDVPF